MSAAQAIEQLAAAPGEAKSAISTLTTSNWAGVVSNIGGTAVLCWLVFSQMPAMQANFEKSLEQVEQRADKRSESLGKAIEKLTDKILK